jgi:hypothetical protein
MYPTLTIQHLQKNWASQVELCPKQDENQSDHNNGNISNNNDNGKDRQQSTLNLQR